ncbi:MAG: hypothetical protein K1Y01_18275 [Vicinamibacteria bacterium]|nr:hypothetical protein [Vicinamibacteria bacterium]
MKLNGVSGAAVALWLLGAGGAKAVAPAWQEVRSEHFTVITNSGDREGRRIAWQFEQIRQALAFIWPWAKVDGGRPFLIFAVKDENSLKTLGPQYWEGNHFPISSFWVSSADRQYVAMRTDLPEPSDPNSNPYRQAYFAYVTTILIRSMPVRTPLWYERGLAEVLSNTIVRAKEIQVGRVIDYRLRRVREGGLIGWDEFLTATGRSKWLSQEAEVELYESQAWAFVHFLLMGDQGAHSSKVSRFDQLLLQGTDPVIATKEAFGDLTRYFSKVNTYVKGTLFRYLTAKVDLNVKAEGFTTRAIPPAEAATLRGSLLVAMRRPVEARALAQEARSADAADPGADEIEAALLDAEGKTEEAQAAYARAVERGSKRAYIYYRLTQLEVGYGNKDKAKLERGTTLLAKANALDPAYANAFSYLSSLKTDLGLAQEAVDLANRAVSLEPNESHHRLTGARALWSGGNKEDAIKVARSAVQAADTDKEKSDAQRFLDFALDSEPPRPRRPFASAPTTSATTPENGARSTAVPAPPVRLGGSDDVFQCFSNRDDMACGKALPVLEESCAHQEGQACRSLGSLFDGGFGVAVNKSRAAQAYDQGCALDDKASCARYTVLQIQGFAPPRGALSGVVYLERLCMVDQVDDACMGWATLLIARKEKGDLAKARGLLQGVCDKPNEVACRMLKSLPAER